MTLDLAKVRADVSIRGMDIGLFRGVWPLDGWDYRRKVTITEQSGNDLTDYQVLVELDSSNFDFTHAQSNGEDVRFTDTVGNLFDYWIKEWDAANEEAKVWVKVPSIPANGTTELYMYYGNPSASSESDGDATFLLFDDFEGGALDTNKWLNAGSETWSVESGYLVIEPTDSNQYLVSKQAVGAYSIVIESKIKSEQAGDLSAHPGLIWHGNTEVGSSHRNDQVYFRPRRYGSSTFENIQPAYFDGSLVSHSGKFGSYFDWNIWYELKVEIIDSSTIRLYGDGELWHTWGNQQYSYEGVGFAAHGGGKDYYDYILVRQYAEPEPSVSIGEEETA